MKTVVMLLHILLTNGLAGDFQVELAAGVACDEVTAIHLVAETAQEYEAPAPVESFTFECVEYESDHVPADDEA